MPGDAWNVRHVTRDPNKEGPDPVTANERPGARGDWQRAAAFAVPENHVVDQFAKVGEDRLRVVAVAAAPHQVRTSADKALVFVRPFDDLRISRAVVH